MGWGTILGDIGGAFVGDPLLGNQLAGAFSGGGGTANVGTSSPTFKRATQLGDLSQQYAFDYSLPQGQKLLGEAESTLQGPLNYYNSLLGGNRQEMLAAEAPEIENIANQANQQKQNISKFTPQGGGQTALLSELPFQTSAAETNLLNTVRPQAAQALTNISAQQAGMSGMITGEGISESQNALNAINTQINALLGKSAQDIPLQQAAGAGLYQILTGNQPPYGGGGTPQYPSPPGGILGALNNLFHPVSTGGLTTGPDPNLENAVSNVPLDPGNYDITPLPPPPVGSP